MAVVPVVDRLQERCHGGDRVVTLCRSRSMDLLDAHMHGQVVCDDRALLTPSLEWDTNHHEGIR